MSNNVIKRTEMRFRSKYSCENRLFLNQIETMIQRHVSKRVSSLLLLIVIIITGPW